jgi:type I restriction enzyme S subunit
MGEWVNCTLEDLGEIIGGGTPSTKRPSYYDGNIAWITPKDLSNYSMRFIDRGERSITEEGYENSSAKKIPGHSILFTSRAPIGYIAISSNEVCTNQGFKSIVPNKKVNFLFLYYLLKFNKNRIEAMGSGTTFKEVSGSVIKKVELSIPQDIEEQKRIASILSSIDSKIELNFKINDYLAA